MTYDFKALSSLDFELLVRDLLQEEWGINLESFKAGRDGGIDLRFSQDTKKTLIIQCKHYLKFSDLIRVLGQEKEKVDRLKPGRYVIVTSLSCTPKDKTKIRDVFLPYCQSTTNDVFSAEDLNNLLGKHPAIERKHFKLWLTSINVMERVLHSEVFAQSDIEIENIKQKIHTYVQNKSFFDALELLNKHHYCIISGIPGIGKTTLAEILLIYHLDQDFEVVKISSDIEEAYKVLNKAKKQIFYYDDFLGQTTLLDKLNKNEDQRLLQFVENCKQSKNSLFILTTREYILNQAKLNYERLASSGFDIRKCIVDLSSYTVSAKAKILYNHLYYSRVPDFCLHALIESKTYKYIIGHKNYSPRIIEWMTIYARSNYNTAEDYVSDFIKNLDNPTRIWEHAYVNQISEASRYILLCLTTLPSGVLLEQLENIFVALYEPSQKFQQHEIHKNFTKALRELDENFITIEKKSKNTYVKFHNPSIRDFMENYVFENSGSMTFLYSNCIYFDQLITLNSFAKKKTHLIEHFIAALNEKFFADNCKTDFLSDNYRPPLHLEDRLVYLLKWQSSNLQTGELIKSVVEKIILNIEEEKSSRYALLNLLKQIKSMKVSDAYFNNLINKAKNYFIIKLEDLVDFDRIIDFAKLYNELSPDEISLLTDKFTNNLKHFAEIPYFDEEDADFRELENKIDELKNVAEYLNLDISVDLSNLERQLELEDYAIDEIDPVSREEVDIEFSEDEIDNIFDLLLENK